MIRAGQDVSFPFSVEGLQYELHVNRAGGVSFGLLGGNTPKGRVSWESELFDDEPIYEDVDLVRNSLKVFRPVGRLLTSYVWEARPHLLRFSASTPRKAPLYAWLTKRLLSRLSGYDMYEYPKGTFVIFRSAPSISSTAP